MYAEIRAGRAEWMLVECMGEQCRLKSDCYLSGRAGCDEIQLIWYGVMYDAVRCSGSRMQRETQSLRRDVCSCVCCVLCVVCNDAYCQHTRSASNATSRRRSRSHAAGWYGEEAGSALI